MLLKSIAYRQIHQKHKIYTPAIWTSFGPHALFHGTLDLTWDRVFDQSVIVGTSLLAKGCGWYSTCFRAHARGRIRLANSSCRTKKRVSLYCRSPCAQTRQVSTLRSEPGPSGRSRCESSVDWASGSRGAQGADDGLRVPLDDGQVGTDGDLRAPPALLPVLQRPHVESE